MIRRSPSDKLKFMTLGPEERKVLLKAIDINPNRLRCYYCEEQLDYATCGIMPALYAGQNATIICNSPLCVSQYLEDMNNKSDVWGKKDEHKDIKTYKEE